MYRQSESVFLSPFDFCQSYIYIGASILVTKQHVICRSSVIVEIQIILKSIVYIELFICHKTSMW